MTDDWYQQQPPPGPHGGYGDPSTGGYSAHGPYGPYGAYGGGYPPPYSPYPPTGEMPSQGSMIGALVMAIILMVTCCGTVSVIGIVFAAMALGEKHDAEVAAKYTRYAWTSNWISLGIILFAAVLIGLAIATSS
ncbi:hypothetical protein [Nocardiopsis aegyptia]|uniref:Interferon-induced transmembrane protein n=1 Tax=Nocardiopsis aegyptia TaxID=220378 RepID=A0A7Z0JC07_9ACTN|nr:hypothetical protein [Nocardiopsis aegyptia]NYJ35974.1 hypothetical protein [Nocardiopsis aegyptia]